MKIHCSGIGGIGLSAYAALQAQNGHEVSGTDRSDSPVIDDLRSLGIAISLDQDGSAVPTDCDLFTYSEAIPVDAPERVRAAQLGIASQSYFHALGDLVNDHFVIAVCGTHGKSSTTAMAAKMLIDAGKDPSVVVGTKMKELGGTNRRKGKSDIFIVEACEYRRSFHHISPDIAIVTTVDGDHFDSFKNIDDYREAFVEFLKRLPADGVAIVHGKDADALAVARSSQRAIIDADAFADPVLGVPGAHMRQNARLVLALAKRLGIEESVARESLQGFSGTWRRMETKGTMQCGALVIDDYGHHPAEIRATLAALREAHPHARIVCVFQPHTHDRTLKLYDDFCAAFSDADVVIVPDIYVARRDIETATVDVSAFAADIAAKSDAEGMDGEGLDATFEKIRSIATQDDVIVTMGAGNVTELSDRLLSA